MKHGTVNNQSRCIKFGGFANIEKETKLNGKTIITYNEEQKNGDVQVVPAWKYFFETEVYPPNSPILN